MSNHFLIIANGAHIQTPHLNCLTKDKKIIALDGAANHLVGSMIEPDYITGDFDSISDKTYKYFSELGVNIINTSDQNYTDLEKAIRFCDQENAKSITITNALGAKESHGLCNISFLKKYFNPNRPIRLVNDYEIIEYVIDCEIELTGKENDPLSVIAFPECHVTSEGLKYEMGYYHLQLGNRESISNSFANNKVKLLINGEAVIFRPAYPLYQEIYELKL